ncbi:hypothetical protein FRB95_007925 [Tulasnella sp. JGI-2019a]|nr:hypothetical protein FRB95_007925 [Tulasnella sp. JGI-2019a]
MLLILLALLLALVLSLGVYLHIDKIKSNRIATLILSKIPGGPGALDIVRQPLVTSPLSFYQDPYATSSDPRKRAYVTILYNEAYIPGALLLGYSLRKHGMLDLSVAQNMVLLYLHERLSKKAVALLKESGWDTRAVDHIPHPPGRPPFGRFMDAYTKLGIFELEEFEQVFYMDADTLVLRPFPEIWLYPVPLAACRDVRKVQGWLKNINGGILLLKPNRRLMQHMLEIAPVYEYNEMTAEQGLLDAYWAQVVTILPYTYNGQLGIRRMFPEVWEVLSKHVKIIHYTSIKPWEWHAPSSTPMERKLWWDMWMEMEVDRRRQGLKSLGDLGKATRLGLERHSSDA